MHPSTKFIEALLISITERIVVELTLLKRGAYYAYLTRLCTDHKWREEHYSMCLLYDKDCFALCWWCNHCTGARLAWLRSWALSIFLWHEMMTQCWNMFFYRTPPYEPGIFSSKLSWLNLCGFACCSLLWVALLAVVLRNWQPFLLCKLE